MSDLAPTSSLTITTGAAAAPRSFDYTDIDEKTKAGLQADAELIQQWKREGSQRIFWIGEKLISAKGVLTHGRFGDWLVAEFGWSERTAQRFMQAAAAFKGKSDTVSVLEATAIYALSAKSTPHEVREAVIARLEAGERLQLNEVKAEIGTARKRAQQEKAQQKAEAQVQTESQSALTPAEVRSREAAEFILKNLGDYSAELLAMLKGADAKALLEALRTGEASLVNGDMQT